MMMGDDGMMMEQRSSTIPVPIIPVVQPSSVAKGSRSEW
jgi:hypothetical protein